MHTPPYAKQKANEKLRYTTGAQLSACEDLEGLGAREVQEGGGACVCMK